MGFTFLQPRCVLGALTLGTVALLVPASARASLVAEERFVYDNDTAVAGATGGGGFAAGWSEPVIGGFPDLNADPELVVSSGLTGTYIGGSGNRLRIDDQQSYVSRPFANSVSSGNLWLSFLIRKDDQPDRAGDYGGLSLTNETSNELFIGDGGGVGDLNFVLEMSGATPGTADSLTPVGTGVTQLVVGIQFDVAGVFDAVRLYINPNPDTFDSGNYAAQKLNANIGTITGVAALSGFGDIDRATPTYSIDEIRVGTSFTDVVPEPTCAASAFVAGAALLLRRRRSGT